MGSFTHAFNRNIMVSCIFQFIFLLILLSTKANNGQREKRQIIINNVESGEFHGPKDMEEKLKDLNLLESEIARRIGNGEASDLTSEEKRRTLESGFSSGIPLSPSSGTLQGAAKSEERQNILLKIYEARDNGGSSTSLALLEEIRQFNPSLPVDVLWKSSVLESQNSLDIIEDLTTNLLSIGDKIGFMDRKKILDEISEKILLLQIKDFCPN